MTARNKKKWKTPQAPTKGAVSVSDSVENKKKTDLMLWSATKCALQ